MLSTQILKDTIRRFKANPLNIRLAVASFTIPISIVTTCCSGFVDIDPPKSELVKSTVFTDDDTAVSAISGIYNRMMTGEGFSDGGIYSVTALCAISADEFYYNSTSPQPLEFFGNTLHPDNYIIRSHTWEHAYKFIFYANSVLEGVNNSNSLSSAVRNQLSGEALFIRAFCYHYLVNLFGDVPLVTSTDYQLNSVSHRAPATQVTQQIIDDLIQAKELLPEEYSPYTNERIRPNRWAAAGLLARAYLYRQDWAGAERESSEVLGVPLYRLESNLDDVFLKNSQEAIWQLMPVQPGLNTKEGRVFLYTDYTVRDYSLTNDLVGAFESNDIRKAHWIDSIFIGETLYYFPIKYKVGYDNQPLTEYSVVMRLAEQLLIRAEARLHLGNLAGSREDINVVRSRAGLHAVNTESVDELTATIEHERRLELFTEWGHRWFDIKRTGRVDEILSPIKQLWRPTAALYPIPQMEINNNPNLVQNPGY